MKRRQSKKVKKWITVEELRQLIRKKEKDVKVLNRLYFVNYLYSGYSVPEASEKLGITKVTGYIWLERWNEAGYEGLIPRFAGGRPPKITLEQKEELKEELSKRDNWTTQEVKDLIKERFEVEYSLKQVTIILRSLGMKYGKPYKLDYRRPENAEEILKKNMDEKIDDDDFVLGFFDETSPKTVPNILRLWSAALSRMKKNSARIKAKNFGFYALNGKSVLDFKQNSKKESVCEFFTKIRDENPEKKIIVIRDNFSSHRTADTRQHTNKLGIDLVFLPPYSPDLNH